MFKYQKDITQTINLKRADDTPLSIEPYFAGDDLRKAVNMAIALGRPLLLKGDPGCGKTRLAEAVAFDIHGAEDFEANYFEWSIKSSSKVSDGIYSFDHIRRLRDAQLERTREEGKRESDNLMEYIDFGPMAEALKKAKKGAKPPILLIDEIDKADIDFPNDLLLELDQMRFDIPELRNSKNAAFKRQGRIVAEAKPLIFITSNDEKDLPPAFLRRCLFHYVNFPEADELAMIVKANFPNFDGILLSKAIEKFQILRGSMQGNVDKKPSTSELLDWVRLMEPFNVTPADLEKDGYYPLHQALLKSQNDVILFNKTSD
jgi:MoxR-like ATPase